MDTEPLQTEGDDHSDLDNSATRKPRSAFHDVINLNLNQATDIWFSNFRKHWALGLFAFAFVFITLVIITSFSKEESINCSNVAPAL